MVESEPQNSLESVLREIEGLARSQPSVSVDDLLDAMGRRSFGPLLLVAGLVVLAPVIGDIPGVPTTIGLLVLLVAAQFAAGRDHIWLPRWLLERSVSRDRLDKPLRWSRKPARVIDKVTRPRLAVFVEGGASRVIAAICLLVAAMMPLMELIPFSANLAGVVLLTFGLALVACDGLLALVGMVATLGTLALAIGYLI